MLLLNPLKTEFVLYNIYKLISYLTGNTSRLFYTGQLIKVL
jgi:hypothetical protein